MIRRKGFHTHVYKQMLMNWIYFLVVFTYVDKIVCINEENESELASWWATESKMYTECVSKMNCIASHFVYIQNLSTLPHNVQTSMCFYINDVTDNNHWKALVCCVLHANRSWLHTHNRHDYRTYLCLCQKLLCRTNTTTRVRGTWFRIYNGERSVSLDV